MPRHMLVLVFIAWSLLMLWLGMTAHAQSPRTLHIECPGAFPRGQGPCLQSATRLTFGGDWAGVELCNEDKTVCRLVSDVLR